MKLLCGRQYDDPSVQLELKRYPFKTCKLDNGGVGIRIIHNNVPIVVLPEHGVAMLLTYMKQCVCSTNENAGIAEAVLAVPHWFNDLQRRSYLKACEIAGISCIQIINESTAEALNYGYFKAVYQQFPKDYITLVMFIDMGYSCYTVSIVGYQNDAMRVLTVNQDTHLGGRDIDDIIVEYLILQFYKKHKMNLRENDKAMLKLYAAAEKAKKTLSPHGVSEAVIVVECIVEDIDLNCTLTREEFESRMEILLDRLNKPIHACLQEAKVDLNQIAEVEITGGSTRVNSIKKHISNILQLDSCALNYGLKCTMNADEAVSRGCAIQCALGVTHVKMVPYTIIDRIHQAMYISIIEESKGASAPEQVGLFSRGDEFPRKPKTVTFKRTNALDFKIAVSYGNKNTHDIFAIFIVHYPTLLPRNIESRKQSVAVDVKVKFALDISSGGCVYIHKAELLGQMNPIPLAVDTIIPGECSPTLQRHAIELENAITHDMEQIQLINYKRNEFESLMYASKGKCDSGEWKKKVNLQELHACKEYIRVQEDWIYEMGECTELTVIEEKYKSLYTYIQTIESKYNVK